MKCEVSGKTCHAYKADAIKHLKNLERRNKKRGGMVYKCQFCNQFHITKSKTINLKKKYEHRRISKYVSGTNNEDV